jgi:mono/diheme cytochrome c family protein
MRSLPPIRYEPPKNRMPFPFNIRETLYFWNLLFFEEGRYRYDSSKSADFNRGAYLVQALGHCGACHTPRNVLGGEIASRFLTGGEYVDQVADEVQDDKIVPIDGEVRTWSTPNLTPAANGLGAWSREELVAYLRTGHNARAGALGPMIDVIFNSTRHLSDSDLFAIASYLKGIAPISTRISDSVRPEQIKAGELAYSARCTGCHLPSGLGIPQDSKSAEKRAPPLAGNAIVQAADPASLINIILHGAHEVTTDAHSWPKMPGFYSEISLDDEQVAALCNFLRSSFGNTAGAVTAAQVARQR